MKLNYLLPVLNLQLFADGAAGGTGDGGAAQGAGVTGAAAVSQTTGVKSTTGNAGDGAPAAGVQNVTEPTVDLNAEFEKLIKGQYKEQYNARVQDTIRKRLSGTTETVDKYNALAPTLDLLSRKYGVDPSDAKALAKAIEDDDTFYQEAADQAGMSVSQYKEYLKVQRENAELKQWKKDQQTKENADRLYATWNSEGESVKQIYPSFDLRTEMQNPEFLNLLKSHVNVRTAYEVVHRDEIIPAAMQFAAQTVEKNLTNKIAANGARPVENGLGGQAPAVTKSDVSQLTPKELKEYQRRIANGERISFTQQVRSS